MGAALLAGKAAGLFPKLEDAVRSMVKVKERFEPNATNYGTYDDLYSKHVKLYDSLVGLFERT